VARLMREEGLHGKLKGHFKPQTTDSRHTRPVTGNLLGRQFAVGSARAAWVGDITYIPTREGGLYLAVVISLQTRQVLGYSLSERMPDELVCQAVLNAWANAPAPVGSLFHSDRGSQYASSHFRRTIQSLGFVQSMSRKGNCWDNAVAESFFATLKREELPGAYKTKAQAHQAIACYVHGFYNPTRMHSALAYLSPNDFAKKLKQNA
jgi:transposase InsO family protein